MATNRICSIPDCGKKHHSRTYCKMHYTRWTKHGDPLETIIALNGEPERFYQDVVLAYDGDECLIWPYAKANGYGVLTRDGKTRRAHRLVCEEINGPPPTPKHDAAHSCGKGHLACVTKGHLFWKTRAENQADRIRHGTSNRGERHGMAKLTEAEAREIRAIRSAETNTTIAARYGISHRTVSDIQTGKSWGWVE